MQKNDAKARLCRLLVRIGLVLLIGLVYFLFTRLTGLGIPCVFHALTGLHCPGCGVSRMCIALLSGDLTGAAHANLLALCLLPLGAVLAARHAYRYVKYGHADLARAELVLCAVAVLAAIAFAVLRNTEAFAFLAPR